MLRAWLPFFFRRRSGGALAPVEATSKASSAAVACPHVRRAGHGTAPGRGAAYGEPRRLRPLAAQTWAIPGAQTAPIVNRGGAAWAATCGHAGASLRRQRGVFAFAGGQAVVTAQAARYGHATAAQAVGRAQGAGRSRTGRRPGTGACSAAYGRGQALATLWSQFRQGLVLGREQLLTRRGRPQAADRQGGGGPTTRGGRGGGTTRSGRGTGTTRKPWG